MFLTGSPLHVYHDNHAVRANVDFMRAVFDAGVPCFGSCAGLHIAVAAAGGTVRRNPDGHEVGLARRIVPTAEGARHPLLEGRPAAFDAPAVHGDEVESLPRGRRAARRQRGLARAGGRDPPRRRHLLGRAVPPRAAAGRARPGDPPPGGGLVERGLARDEAEVEAQAALFEALGREPGRLDVAWRLGVDREVAEDGRRTAELGNALRHLIEPARARRGRGESRAGRGHSPPGLVGDIPGH